MIHDLFNIINGHVMTGQVVNMSESVYITKYNIFFYQDGIFTKIYQKENHTTYVKNCDINYLFV